MAAAFLLAAIGVLCGWILSATRRPSPVASPANDGPNTGNRLTVTFWNVEWFPGQRPNAPEPKRREHVAAVAPVVERLDPDILGLEEVADRDAAQLLVDHLKGFKVDVCSEFTRDGAPSRQQEVLCSRLPLIQGFWERWQPGVNGRIPARGFTFAAYRLPAGGGIVLVYGLHLKSNRVDENSSLEMNIADRGEAMRQLLVRRQAMAPIYNRMGPVVLTIVAGDMNTSLDDPRFAAETSLRDLRSRGSFRWAWEGVPTDARLTLPAEGRYPATCFDHIFFHGGPARLLACAMEPTDHTASDHRPVTATFAIAGDALKTVQPVRETARTN